MSAARRPRACSRCSAPRRVSRLSRWSLWALLIALVAALLVTLVWLAGRYEASQVQSKLERDTADALGRHPRGADAQRAEPAGAAVGPSHARRPGAARRARLLREHREWMRMEWRDSAPGHRGIRGHTLSLAGVRAPGPGQRPGRRGAGLRQRAAASAGRPIPAAISCRSSTASGMEVMELCLPLVTAGQLTGYVVATYSLS